MRIGCKLFSLFFFIFQGSISDKTYAAGKMDKQTDKKASYPACFFIILIL